MASSKEVSPHECDTGGKPEIAVLQLSMTDSIEIPTAYLD